MKGNNNLWINQATMQEAVQYYFTNVVFKRTLKVSDVKEENKGFRVTVQETETPGVTE